MVKEGGLSRNQVAKMLGVNYWTLLYRERIGFLNPKKSKDPWGRIICEYSKEEIKKARALFKDRGILGKTEFPRGGKK
ncbi:MAG: hypothetical protein KAX15_04850 [Candidatus Omnitrophica bacterium]|nr:hypothetical protein [Candidatus Omnitrophota bacterium]